MKVKTQFELSCNNYDVSDEEFLKLVKKLLAYLKKIDLAQEINVSHAAIVRNDYYKKVEVKQCSVKLVGQDSVLFTSEVENPERVLGCDILIRKVLLDVLNDICYKLKLAIAVSPVDLRESKYSNRRSVREEAGKLVSVKVVDEPKGKGVEIKTSTGALYYYTVNKKDPKYNTPEKLANAVRGLAGKYNRNMGRIYNFLRDHAISYNSDITARANLKKAEINVESHGKGLIVSLDNGQVYRYTVNRRDSEYTSLESLKSAVDKLWETGASVDKILEFLDAHAMLYAREGKGMRTRRARVLKEETGKLPFKSSADRLLGYIDDLKKDMYDGHDSLSWAETNLIYDDNGIIAKPDFYVGFAQAMEKNSPFKGKIFSADDYPNLDYWKHNLEDYFAKWDLRESKSLKEADATQVWKLTGIVWDKTDENGNAVDIYLPDTYLIPASETTEKGIAEYLYDKFGYFADEFDCELDDGFDLALVNEAKETEYSTPTKAEAKDVLKAMARIDIDVANMADMIIELIFADSNPEQEDSDVDREFIDGLEKVFNKENPFKKGMYEFTELYDIFYKWKKDVLLFFAKWGLKESKQLKESVKDLPAWLVTGIKWEPSSEMDEEDIPTEKEAPTQVVIPAGVTDVKGIEKYLIDTYDATSWLPADWSVQVIDECNRIVESDVEDKPEWEVYNIDWEVQFDDAMYYVTEMPDKVVAKVLHISVSDYLALSEEELKEYVRDAIKDSRVVTSFLYGIPEVIEISAGETDEAGIADWLHAHYGWTAYSYDADPIYNEFELTEAEDLSSNKKFDLVEVFGQKALYTDGRFKVDGPFNGTRLYAYDVKGCDDDPKEPGTLESRVLENRIGSMMFLKSIKTPVMLKGQIKFTGDQLTVAEYIAIYGTRARTA